MGSESVVNLTGQTEEKFAPRPYHYVEETNDTSVLVTVASEDRKPPHGTVVSQLIIYTDEGFKVRRGKIGRCPHCHRDLRIRIIAERLH